jgi:histidine phosphotransferase ChpT
MHATDFASLLASKLCHDLLNPVGAISNGLELMADERDTDMRARCLELVEQSTQAAAAKLKFYRLAFGAAGGFGDLIPARETKEALSDLIAVNGKITLNWLVREDNLEKPVAKIILNLAHIAMDALVRGGTLTIAYEAGAASREIGVMAQGDKLIFSPEIRAMLTGETAADQATTRTAAAYLVQNLAASYGGQILMQSDQEGALTLGTSLKV